MTDDEDYLIENIMDVNGNTDFRENFRSFTLDNFFKENNGENKVLFATKYIEVSEQYEDEEVTPEWIKEVKKFFNS